MNIPMNTLDFLPSLVKIVSALSLTLGLLFVCVYFLRRILERKNSIYQKDMITVLSTRYLGSRNSIMVVEVCGEILVVGLTQNQMSLLAKIAASQVREQVHKLQEEPLPFSFSDYLSLKQGRFAAPFNFLKKHKKENV